MARERIGNTIAQIDNVSGVIVEKRHDVAQYVQSTMDKTRTWEEVEEKTNIRQDLRPASYRHGKDDGSGFLGSYLGNPTAADLLSLKDDLHMAYQMISDPNLTRNAMESINLGQIGEFVHDGVKAMQEGRNPLAKYKLENLDPNERGAAYLLGKVIASGVTIRKSADMIHRMTTDFHARDWIHLLDGFQITHGSIEEILKKWLSSVAMIPLQDWATSGTAQMVLGWLSTELWGAFGSEIALGQFGVLLTQLGIGVSGFVALIPAIIFNIYNIMVSSEAWYRPWVQSQSKHAVSKDNPYLKPGDFAMVVKGYKTVDMPGMSIGEAEVAALFQADEAPTQEWRNINHIKVPQVQLGVVTEASEAGMMKVQFIDDKQHVDGHHGRRLLAEHLMEGTEVQSINVHGVPAGLTQAFLSHKQFAIFQEVVREASEYMRLHKQKGDWQYMLSHPHGTDDMYTTEAGHVYDTSNSRNSFTQNGHVFRRGMLCEYHHDNYTWRLGLICNPMVESSYFRVWDVETGKLQDEVRLRPVAVPIVNLLDTNRHYKKWRQRCLNGENNMYQPLGESLPSVMRQWNSQTGMKALTDIQSNDPPGGRGGLASRRRMGVLDGTRRRLPGSASTDQVPTKTLEPVTKTPSTEGPGIEDSPFEKAYQEFKAEKREQKAQQKGSGDASGGQLLMAGVAGIAIYYLFIK